MKQLVFKGVFGGGKVHLEALRYKLIKISAKLSRV